MASAAILTGGRASRLGGLDKAALVVGGLPIFDRQLRELSRVTDDILVVGRRVSSVAASPPEGVAVRQILDRIPAQGPLGGIDAALSNARDENVLVLACDMPFVTAGLIEHLLDSLADRDAVVPETDRGYHPLCAVYTRRCLPAIQRRLAEGHLAVRGVFEDLRVRVITASEMERFGDPLRLLANINTPAEREALDTVDADEV